MSLGNYHNLINNNDAIIGISTNIDKVSALALIRISGPIGPEDLSGIISLNPKNIKARFQHFCKIEQNGRVLDEILLTFFKGPHSFTGENCFELSLHGNPISVKRIVSYLCEKLNLRLAEKGEFTLRALKNKKLNLSQVEGLDNFLHAQSITALNSSLTILNGELHNKFIDLQASFLKLKMAIDMNTDFAEDIGEKESEILFKDALEKFYKNIEFLQHKVVRNPDILQTPSVCLVGAVNAGKSTLFNSILNENRSIVSDEKGTTRDYVSEQVFSNELYYKLIDTAGLRSTKNKVEAEGIKRSIEILKNSFYKILVISCTDLNSIERFKDLSFDLVVFTHADKLQSVNQDYSLIAKKFVIVDQLKGLGVGPVGFSSADGSIGPENSSGSMGPENLDGSMGPENSVGSMGPEKSVGSMGPDNSGETMGQFVVSQLKLLKLFKSSDLKVVDISDIINIDLNQSINHDVIFVKRQVESIKVIYGMASEINNLSKGVPDIGIMSQLISNLDIEISTLIGVYTAEDVLNNIFSNFCIGK